jgi:hypothetical protein
VFVRVQRRSQSGSWQKFADAAIEAFNHAVCLGMAWRNKAMVNLGAGAGPIEDMIARGLLLPGSEAVGELCAVVRQDRTNVNRTDGLQAFEEVQAAFFALVIVDVQENPTAGALNVTASRSSKGNSSRRESSTTSNSCAVESVVCKVCARCERSSGFSYPPRADAIWMS